MISKDSDVLNQWWRGAVIYQIYPRSFLDTNKDGVGDLRGIIQRLDYVASLGVDAIWVSPFFASPMKDFGYDVSNYREVDPLFGNLQDFKDLVAKAHQLNLKVLIDQVFNHTSDQHAWFTESRASRDNPKADWYVWADPKPDGTPPNNWLSILGGVAWQWEARRQQYYLHNFLVSQPDLNFHNPEVRQALLKEMEFWLELGVDGFRMDAVNFYFHNRLLQDNPALPDGAEKAASAFTDNPYTYQQHQYDITQPENIEYIRELRILLDQYQAVMMGEISDDHPLQTMAAYTVGADKLHMAYTFDLLAEKCGAAYIRGVLEDINNELGDGWPCWAMSNHDAIRVVSRLGEGAPPEQVAPVYFALLLCIKGTVCVYQGEELGLTEADIPYEKVQDPFGKIFWPAYKGRDGCRTPMPWDSSQVNAGFSEVEPWLSVPEEHFEYARDRQEENSKSILNRFRTFINWRKDIAPLIKGEIKILPGDTRCVLFMREYKGERVLVAINVSGESVKIEKPVDGILIELKGHGFAGSYQNDCIMLNAYDAFFAKVC